MNICKIDRCNKSVKARGMCTKHLTRWYKGRPVEDPEPKIWDQVDIAWIAGIIEGEGCIHTQETHKGPNKMPRVKVNMTDEDIVKRLFDTTGIGTFRFSNPPSYKKKGYKPQWVWAVSRKNEVYRLLLAIYPMLGERKQGQIKEITKLLGN